MREGGGHFKGLLHDHIMSPYATINCNVASVQLPCHFLVSVGNCSQTHGICTVKRAVTVTILFSVPVLSVVTYV